MPTKITDPFDDQGMYTVEITPIYCKPKISANPNIEELTELMDECINNPEQ